MKTKRFFSLLTAAAVIISLFGAIPVSAQENNNKQPAGGAEINSPLLQSPPELPAQASAPETCTYYFVAPDSWFKTECGALNEDIGACLLEYEYTDEETFISGGDMPGLKMQPAPEIGTNVFKITGVPQSADHICFNDYTTGHRADEKGAIHTYCSDFVPTRRFTYGDIQSDSAENDLFDGMIYVLNINDCHFPNLLSDDSVYGGKWFTLDDYKNYADYYGSYDLPDSPDYDKITYTYYFAAPDSWFRTDSGAANEYIGVSFKQGSFESGEISVGFDDSSNSSDKPDTHDIPDSQTVSLRTLPGAKMTAAPEIGENVFKISGVPQSAGYICFNDYSDIESISADRSDIHCTDYVSTQGYTDGAPYRGAPWCTSFDGMIYVMNMNKTDKHYDPDYEYYGGAWFTLDNYKNYAAYYGSYGLPDSPDRDPYSYTYYFLAPTHWFDVKNGAANDKIAYTQRWSDGGYLTPAPEIGENVFKVKGISRKVDTIRFTAAMPNIRITPTDHSLIPDTYRTCFIDLMGGYNGDCPYDSGVQCHSFDDMIYVLDGTTDFYGEAHGAWFTLDDYENHDDYYGTYGLNGEAAEIKKDNSFTLYFLAPNNWIRKEYGADNINVGCVIQDLDSGVKNDEFPGVKMTTAPEIGQNVYKITGFSDSDFSISFNNCGQYLFAAGSKTAKRTENIEIRLNKDGSCPCADMIYVMDLNYRGTDAQPVYKKGDWFTLDDYKNHDDYYGTYALDTNNEKIILQTHIDIDGDGQVTSNDTLIALRISAEAEPVTDRIFNAADIDSDGVITSTDALIILRMSAGLHPIAIA